MPGTILILGSKFIVIDVTADLLLKLLSVGSSERRHWAVEERIRWDNMLCMADKGA